MSTSSPHGGQGQGSAGWLSGRGPDQGSGGQDRIDQRSVHPEQESGIARRVRAAGNRVRAADMILDAPHPGRGSHGHCQVAEGECGRYAMVTASVPTGSRRQLLC